MTTLDAQVVWQVWRRILREPALQHAVFSADPAKALDDSFGLHGEAREAALTYAMRADRTRWFVTNYRFRLANSFLNALETGAPLTLRALLALGCDVHASGNAFLDRCGWKDYGPYVHGYCKDALTFLRETLDSDRLRRVAPLIAFEESTVEWLIEQSRRPRGGVLDAARDARAGLIERTHRARYHRSEMQLSAWLRDKTQLGVTLLVVGVEHYFIYLKDARSAVRFARVPARAVTLYDALEVPCTHAELSGALEQRGAGPLTEQDLQFLSMLEACHAIRGSGAVPS
ncbi:hypothetical protein [Burkholderia sp. SCN-KJ]|uniref:hypothetical protein n=1 Tax=Burkholderia sp. SCN-KJ TaxID=2969248 RepID=UPI0021503FF1|nr:hypothetical protein [Burkholderia sp. SCN-KJ]MCR4471354.1 hypothetical protein [Burkholderia sp. SCN-KJ]